MPEWASANGVVCSEHSPPIKQGSKALNLYHGGEGRKYTTKIFANMALVNRCCLPENNLFVLAWALSFNVSLIQFYVKLTYFS